MMWGCMSWCAYLQAEGGVGHSGVAGPLEQLVTDDAPRHPTLHQLHFSQDKQSVRKRGGLVVLQAQVSRLHAGASTLD